MCTVIGEDQYARAALRRPAHNRPAIVTIGNAGDDAFSAASTRATIAPVNAATIAHTIDLFMRRPPVEL
jgi:hypothetical protein